MEVLFQHVKEISKFLIYLNFNPFFKFYNTPRPYTSEATEIFKSKCTTLSLSIVLINFLRLDDFKISYMFSNLISAHEKIFKNMRINLLGYSKYFLSLVHIYLTFMLVFNSCL